MNTGTMTPAEFEERVYDGYVLGCYAQAPLSRDAFLRELRASDDVGAMLWFHGCQAEITEEDVTEYRVRRGS